MSRLPLPFIPELAQRYGANEAIMLAVVMELIGDDEGEVVISEQRLYSRVKHLDRQQQAQLLLALMEQGLVHIAPQSPGLLKVGLQLSHGLSTAKPAHGMQRPPVGTVPAPQSVASAAPRTINRHQRDDELSRIFAVKEAEQSQLLVMHSEWQPSANILRLMSHNHQIEEAFALSLVDEFVVYYMDKNRRESPGGWDKSFLQWVKREHVSQQTRNARAQQQSENYTQHEEARYLAREKRRQLTEAVLDINNTDW